MSFDPSLDGKMRAVMYRSCLDGRGLFFEALLRMMAAKRWTFIHSKDGINEHTGYILENDPR